MSGGGGGFELTRPLGLPVFKTGAINRSATPPEKRWALGIAHPEKTEVSIFIAIY